MPEVIGVRWRQVTDVKTRADKLFEKVLATGERRRADELLREFVRGYPLDRLRQLLRSENPEVVKTGVFIASELGRGAKPLIEEFASLLSHEALAVRFDTLDCVLVCATEQHGDLIARAARLIRDPEEGVRYKTLVFLSRASETQLRAALPFVDAPDLREAMSWLISHRSMDHEAILEGLREADPLRRRFAAAAAARPKRFDVEALKEAAASDDPEVASFAESELRIMGHG